MDELTALIEQWSMTKELDNGNPYKQMNKVTEEIGELAEGINKNKPKQIEDSIGDAFVTLVILSQQYGMDMGDCVAVAYDEIKNRTGEIRDGIFVKSDDL